MSDPLIRFVLTRSWDGAWLGHWVTEGEEGYEAFRILSRAKAWAADFVGRKRLSWQRFSDGQMYVAEIAFSREPEDAP